MGGSGTGKLEERFHANENNKVQLKRPPEDSTSLVLVSVASITVTLVVHSFNE